MTTLPKDGEQNWGVKLNEWLQVAHNEDGTLSGVMGTVNVRDFGAKGDGDVSQAALNRQAVQEAIDSIADKGGTIYFPQGRYPIDGTLYFNGHAIQLVGEGVTTEIYYVGSGGTILAANADAHSADENYPHYNYCGIRDLRIFSLTADIGIDLTGFSYSTFSSFTIQLKGNNRKLIWGVGNSGSSPYYNNIENFTLFGDNDGANSFGSVGIAFEEGAWAGGSNGPNGNFISNLKRAAALAYLFDLRAGNGNHGTQLNGESIYEVYFRLNFRESADESGVATPEFEAYALDDISKSWTESQWVGDAIKIVAGTGTGQIRRISNNTETRIWLEQSWTVLPDASSHYEIYEGKCHSNAFSHIRAEGSVHAGPDFIQSHPGARNNSVQLYSVSSIGNGATVFDEVKDPSNKYWDGDLVVMDFYAENVAADTTIDMVPRHGDAYYQGGVSLHRTFVVESITVQCNGQVKGTADCTLVVSNSHTLTCQINGKQRWMVWRPDTTNAFVKAMRNLYATITTSNDWAPISASFSMQVFVRLLE